MWNSDLFYMTEWKEWRMESEEWRMKDGEWRMESEGWRVKDAEWSIKVKLWRVLDDVWRGGEKIFGETKHEIKKNWFFKDLFGGVWGE